MTGLENPTQLLFILIVAVLVLGPKRLPELGRSLGSGIHSFKASLNGEEVPVGEEAEEPSDEIASVAAKSSER
jgi:sec-independent protein translocase protein TatA